MVRKFKKQTGEKSSCIETNVLSSDVVVMDRRSRSSIGLSTRSGDMDIMLVHVEPPSSSGKANGAVPLNCRNRFWSGVAAERKSYDSF